MNLIYDKNKKLLIGLQILLSLLKHFQLLLCYVASKQNFSLSILGVAFKGGQDFC